MGDFKPGDVVVHPKFGRGIAQEEDAGWVVFADHYCAALPDVAADLRRLVVIDPEDREQVERLRDLMDEAWVDQGNGQVEARTRGARGNALQAALREFANPKPPRIEEPGTWGVVVASCVHSDVRGPWVKHPDGNWWPVVRSSNSDDWDSLVNPVLIREGVQP